MIDPDAFNAFEAAGWGERVGGYHRFFAAITGRLVGPLLDAAAVSRGTRLLDVATGPGYVAAAAADRGASVVGVDVAEEMLALARSLHPGLELVRGDIERLPFEDGAFDAVVGNFVILHVGRPEACAAELARVLAPGGRLALTTWDVPSRMRLLGILLDAVGEVGAPPPADLPAGPPMFRFADEAEFARLLAEAGLVDVEVQSVSFGHVVASADELWQGLLEGTVRARPLVVDQSPEAQARIREAFDRITARHEAAGGFEIPVAVKVASGCRPAA
jgi:SAM-dependent methyltransferase